MNDRPGPQVHDMSPNDIAELDRRWAAVRLNGAVPNDEVVRWIETWRAPRFRSWHDR